MRVLILGGTGAMGAPLIEVLSEEKNKEIFVTSREEHADYKNIKYIKINAHNYEAINKIISKDTYDCIVDFMNYSLNEFEERYDFFLSNTKQYIFVSSARVYDQKDSWINERDKRLLDKSNDSFFLRTKEYSLEKAREENLLIESRKKNYTIIRPYITYNKNRLQLGVYEMEDWLYRAMKGQKIIIQQELLNKRTTLTYGNDVAFYISKLINNNSALGEIYNITENKSTLTWKDVIDIYKKVLSKYDIELEYKLTNTFFKDRKYQLLYDRYFNRVFDASKIIKECNYIITGSIEEKIEKCINSSFDNVNDNVSNLKLQAYMDKELNNFSTLKFLKGIKRKIKYIIYRCIV